MCVDRDKCCCDKPKETERRDASATNTRRGRGERERGETLDSYHSTTTNATRSEQAPTHFGERERERERLHSPARTITALQARTAVAGVAAALLRL